MTREDWAGFQCGDGWEMLVRELDRKLKERWPEYAIHQVKEKFGTLRFYADCGPLPGDCGSSSTLDERQRENIDAFRAIVSEYEARSAEVCELCGRPGKLGDVNRWMATRCPDCAPQGWVACGA